MNITINKLRINIGIYILGLSTIISFDWALLIVVPEICAKNTNIAPTADAKNNDISGEDSKNNSKALLLTHTSAKAKRNIKGM